jgi:hypothetical protein
LGLYWQMYVVACSCARSNAAHISTTQLAGNNEPAANSAPLEAGSQAKFRTRATGETASSEGANADRTHAPDSTGGRSAKLHRLIDRTDNGTEEE